MEDVVSRLAQTEQEPRHQRDRHAESRVMRKIEGKW